jgi:uracil-DNA glycosylase family 4
MSLDLDSRRRAMLAEMGVRVFEPLHEEQLEPAAAVAPAVTAARPVPLSAAPAMPPAVAPALRAAQAAPPRALDAPQTDEIAAMSWEALAAAVAAGLGCPADPQGRAGILGIGDLRPDWLIVGEPADENELRAGEPFVAEPGALLDNMLKAVGVSRRSKAYLTNVVKCGVPGGRNPSAQELVQCEPVLRRQVQLLQPRVILAMGRFAAQALLESTEPLGKLRGRAHQYAGVPVVVTYPPSYLLRSPLEKARAWADLCLARSFVG